MVNTPEALNAPGVIMLPSAISWATKFICVDVGTPVSVITYDDFASLGISCEFPLLYKIFTPAPCAPVESVLPRRSWSIPVSLVVVSLVVYCATLAQSLKFMLKGTSLTRLYLMSETK